MLALPSADAERRFNMDPLGHVLSLLIVQRQHFLSPDRCPKYVSPLRPSREDVSRLTRHLVHNRPQLPEVENQFTLRPGQALGIEATLGKCDLHSYPQKGSHRGFLQVVVDIRRLHERSRQEPGWHLHFAEIFSVVQRKLLLSMRRGRSWSTSCIFGSAENLVMHLQYDLNR